MAMIRFVVGKLILFFDWLFTPKRIQRDSAQQAGIDEQTALLTLYQYEACPFCVKVRRAVKRYGLHIEVRDVKRDSAAKNELLAGGGQLKVPCLRIGDGAQESSWMYESGDIVAYLAGRFAVR